MRQFLRWTVIISSIAASAYKFRYRLLNLTTKLPALRKAIVRMTMNVPWLRQRLLASMFQRE